MRKPIKLMVTALAAAMIAAAPIVLSERSVHAGPGGVEINETNFPDKAFRMCLTETTVEGADGILTDEEIQDMTWLSCTGMGIKSLKGIEFLTELEFLDCSGNELTSLNVTSNKKLEELYCQDNSLEYVLVLNCPALKILYCNNNKLTSLDLRKNTELTDLLCMENQLTKINLKYNTALVELNCDNNMLVELDVSKLSQLKSLSCGYNELKKLDLTHNPKLESLTCSENYLDELNVSKNTDLGYLCCYCNFLTSLDVSKNTKLTGLDVDYNELGTLDLSKNTKLDLLSCANCGLESLDISKNPLLEILGCRGNRLTSIDLSHNPKLHELYVSSNQLEALDISKCKELWFLDCEGNNIKTLSIYNNSGLIDTYKNGKRTEEDGSFIYYMGDYPEGTTSYIIVDPSTQILLTKPTATPTATPTPKPSSSSEGGVEGFVERLYSVALDRASDPNGKADWVSQIKSGKLTGADAARGFFLSPEFINSGLSDDEFLNRLYHTFFDREPDQGGFNNWKAQLASGASRESVLNGFINSTEWANLCLKFGIASGGTGVPNITIEPSEEVIGFATRLYTTCLCREPDAGGLNDWASQLANMKISGSVAAHGFFFSQEFLDGNYSDAEYVTRLYHTFMNREPDPAGFADWTGQLAAGASRESVFQGFAGSQEWAGICADYGILK